MSRPEELGRRAASRIAAARRIGVSAVSCLEVAVAAAKGRISLDRAPLDRLESHDENTVEEPLGCNHAPLAERLKKGALSLEQTLRTAIEIADALDKAHRQGVIHRDLKWPRDGSSAAHRLVLGHAGVAAGQAK